MSRVKSRLSKTENLSIRPYPCLPQSENRNMRREVLIFGLINSAFAFNRQQWGHFPIICPTGERIQVPDHTYSLDSYILHNCNFDWTCNRTPLSQVYRFVLLFSNFLETSKVTYKCSKVEKKCQNKSSISEQATARQRWCASQWTSTSCPFAASTTLATPSPTRLESSATLGSRRTLRWCASCGICGFVTFWLKLSTSSRGARGKRVI